MPRFKIRLNYSTLQDEVYDTQQNRAWTLEEIVRLLNQETTPIKQCSGCLHFTVCQKDKGKICQEWQDRTGTEIPGMGTY